MTPLELLDIYWDANHLDPEDVAQLNSLAADIIQGEQEIE
jgi:hypothetical protein